MFMRHTLTKHLRTSNFLSFNRKFIGTGAINQTDSSKVKIRGKFLKSRNEDMPTMLWFPEVMEPAENWEKWLQRPENKILDYRNVWLLNSRNFGDSDHHNSFDLEEVANDINRFLEDNKLTTVTVGGHGYGAKVASAFGSYFYDRTSGVICLEGGPIDNTYHESSEELKNAITACSKIKLDNTSVNDVHKKIDAAVEHAKWRAILKQNLVEGKSSLQWKFNMEYLALNVKKHVSDIVGWSAKHGLYPGRAFVLFAEYSRWIFMNTNTIPFYCFFPKLEGRFPSSNFNFVQTPDDPLNHWIHEYPEDQRFTVMNRIARFLKYQDGVHVLLADRTEVGWYGIPERESKSTNHPGLAEYVPEHVHHNYRNTDAYVKSKERRQKKAASLGEFKTGLSNPELW